MLLKELLTALDDLDADSEVIPILMANPEYIPAPDGSLVSQPTHIMCLNVGGDIIAIKTRRSL